MLFRPGVVVGGNAGGLRDLLAAQPLRTPAYPLDQPDVAGAQSLTPVAQECRHFLLVHAPHTRRIPPAYPETADPWMSTPLPSARSHSWVRRRRRSRPDDPVITRPA